MLLIVFLSYILFNYRIASKISNHQFDEILITGFIIQATSIILSGYILSFFRIWDNTIAWSLIPYFVSYLLYLFFSKAISLPEISSSSSFKLIGSSIQGIHELYKQQKQTEKFLFGFIFVGIIGISICQIFLLFNIPPNEWDSMTGHLNRILYFLQNHSTSHFIGTNWNIDTYPKAFSSIQLYPFLMNGYNEYLFKIPNWSAYWILFVGLYAILKQLNIPFKVRFLSSCLFLFTPIVLIQSVSTDTDIVLASYLIVSVYFLFRYINTREKYYIYVFVLASAVAFSHKITWVFSIPSIIFLLIFVRENTKNIKLALQLKHLILSCIFVILVTFPTGYLANLKYYHHPIGPETATKHQSIERAGDLNSLVKNGSRNVLRYTFDLLHFDGLTNIPKVEEFQQKITNQYKKIDTFFNLRLENETRFTIIPFSFNRKFEFLNGTPILGSIFLLVIIPTFFLLFIRRAKKYNYYLLIAFLLHFLALAFTAAYDPWKGRYMISSVVFLYPITHIYFQKFVDKKQYLALTFIFAFIIISAWSTLLFHSRSALLTTHHLPTIWNKTRIQLLTISRPDITKAYQNFDNIVPQNAVVALGTINDDYEYPLWGEKFSRKLIPINPFEKGLQPIPKEADYLFFSKNVIKPLPTDIRLGTDTTLREHIIVKGEDYYLRNLK